MSKPLPLPERQVTALCKGAAKAGYAVKVVIDGVEVWLVPDRDKPKEEEIRL